MGCSSFPLLHCPPSLGIRGAGRGREHSPGCHGKLAAPTASQPQSHGAGGDQLPAPSFQQERQLATSSFSPCSIPSMFILFLLPAPCNDPSQDMRAVLPVSRRPREHHYNTFCFPGITAGFPSPPSHKYGCTAAAGKSQCKQKEAGCEPHASFLGCFHPGFRRVGDGEAEQDCSPQTPCSGVCRHEAKQY